jgi:hypothetical protein
MVRYGSFENPQRADDVDFGARKAGVRFEEDRALFRLALGMPTSKQRARGKNPVPSQERIQ